MPAVFVSVCQDMSVLGDIPKEPLEVFIIKEGALQRWSVLFLTILLTIACFNDPHFIVSSMKYFCLLGGFFFSIN